MVRVIAISLNARWETGGYSFELNLVQHQIAYSLPKCTSALKSDRNVYDSDPHAGAVVDYEAAGSPKVDGIQGSIRGILRLQDRGAFVCL